MTALATPADLRAFLDDQDLNEARAQLLLDAVSDEIRSAVGWSVTEETDVTVTLDGSGRPELLLPTLHLTAVTEVTENGALLSAADHLDYPDGRLLRISHGSPARWTCKPQGVTVSFHHGYPLDAVPGVFKTVTLETVGQLYDNPGGTLKSETVGRVSVSYADTRAMLPPIEDGRLDYYRLPDGF